MSRNTGNRKVIEALQNALEDFLADHKKHAHTDPEWNPEDFADEPGCGCRDCRLAGELLGVRRKYHVCQRKFCVVACGGGLRATVNGE
jgi:hypothetical protein